MLFDCNTLNGCLVNELDDFLATYNFSRVDITWDGVTWGRCVL